MKKLLLVISLFAVIGITSLNPINACPKNHEEASVISLEWTEYVLIGDQWYEIIHYDDDSFIIKPVGAPIRD